MFHLSVTIAQQEHALQIADIYRHSILTRKDMLQPYQYIFKNVIPDDYCKLFLDRKMRDFQMFGIIAFK